MASRFTLSCLTHNFSQSLKAWARGTLPVSTGRQPDRHHQSEAFFASFARSWPAGKCVDALTAGTSSTAAARPCPTDRGHRPGRGTKPRAYALLATASPRQVTGTSRTNADATDTVADGGTLPSRRRGDVVGPVSSTARRSGTRATHRVQPSWSERRQLPARSPVQRPAASGPTQRNDRGAGRTCREQRPGRLERDRSVNGLASRPRPHVAGHSAGLARAGRCPRRPDRPHHHRTES